MTLGPWTYATGGLAAALALSLAWGMRVDQLRGDHKAALAATERAYAEAQHKAQAAFNAQVAALKSHNRRLNDAAQKQSDDLRLVYRDRVIRLPAAAAHCDAGSTAMPSPDHADDSHRSGRDTVVLTRADALICATNTARLESARNWALGWKHAAIRNETIIDD